LQKKTLHTVLITDPDTSVLFEKYRYLFAPFFSEHEGSVCQCEWKKGFNNIERAVPTLYSSIKDHPEWRAIILVKPKQSELFDPNNPFDFEINHEKPENVHGKDEGGFYIDGFYKKENPTDLVRLTYMLAGLPSLGIKKYETAYVYYDDKTGTYKECIYNKKRILQSDLEEKDVTKEVEERLNKEYTKNNIKWQQKDKDIIEKEEKQKKEEERKRIEIRLKTYENIKLKLIEVHYQPEDKAIYKKLTERYAFKENRPVEVIILAIREQYASDDREEILEEVRRAWQYHDEVESSDFWKVYPNCCRFLCYDLINPDHSLYFRELWKFFLLTLTLAVNQIPGRSLQAYFLYNVNLQIDTEELSRVYDKYMENLMSFQEILQERLLHVSELTKEKKKELVPDQYIDVSFDQIEEGDVKAKSNKLGLAADCPVSEAQFWYDHIQGTRQIIENILLAPQEIAAEKAIETRKKINNFAGIEQVLDRFQIERIRKRIDGLETKIFNTNLFNMLNTDNYKSEVAKAGDAVRDYIKIRVTKRSILLISLVSLLAYFFGFIPYLFNSAKSDLKMLGAAIGLVVAVSLLLAAGAVIVLCFLRGKLVNKIKTYNKDVSNIFERIKRSAKVFSEYFSDICTYMYARSLQTGIILKKDNDKTAEEIQKAHLKYLKNEIERINSVCSLYGAPLNDYSGKCSITNINDELLTEWPNKCRFYELAPFNEENTVKLTTSPLKQKIKNISTDNNDKNWEQFNTGITMNAPYSFVTAVNLVREEIYERKEEA